MPTTAYDAKGMLLSAIKDDSPVIIFEHRWLYNVDGIVPKDPYEVNLNSARVLHKGDDITIVATSYMVLEALKASEILSKHGIKSEVIDLRSIVPLDIDTIIESVKKTNRVVTCEEGFPFSGIGAEISALISEKAS